MPFDGDLTGTMFDDDDLRDELGESARMMQAVNIDTLELDGEVHTSQAIFIGGPKTLPLH